MLRSLTLIGNMAAIVQNVLMIVDVACDEPGALAFVAELPPPPPQLANRNAQKGASVKAAKLNFTHSSS